MKLQPGPTLIAAVVVAAGAYAFLHSEGPPPEPVATHEPASDPNAEAPGMGSGPDMNTLPPNHPAIPPGMASNMPMAADDGPTLAWTAPPTWQTAPNPNSMRLATYKPSATTEVSVSRAGGATEANINRWVGMFQDASAPLRSERTVAGFHVAEVQVSGGYNSGPMMGGSSGTPTDHGDWALLGAVVETPGTYYFFKLTGPKAEVAAQRPAFDAMIGSLHTTS